MDVASVSLKLEPLDPDSGSWVPVNEDLLKLSARNVRVEKDWDSCCLGGWLTSKEEPVPSSGIFDRPIKHVMQTGAVFQQGIHLETGKTPDCHSPAQYDTPIPIAVYQNLEPWTRTAVSSSSCQRIPVSCRKPCSAGVSMEENVPIRNKQTYLSCPRATLSKKTRSMSPTRIHGSHKKCTTNSTETPRKKSQQMTLSVEKKYAIFNIQPPTKERRARENDSYCKIAGLDMDLLKKGINIVLWTIPAELLVNGCILEIMHWARPSWATLTNWLSIWMGTRFPEGYTSRKVKLQVERLLQKGRSVLKSGTCASKEEVKCLELQPFTLPRNWRRSLTATATKKTKKRSATQFVKAREANKNKSAVPTVLPKLQTQSLNRNTSTPLSLWDVSPNQSALNWIARSSNNTDKGSHIVMHTHKALQEVSSSPHQTHPILNLLMNRPNGRRVHKQKRVLPLEKIPGKSSAATDFLLPLL